MSLDPRRVLLEYPLAVQPIGAVEPLGNAGGLSGASLWRFASARGPLVLRAWPENGPTPGDVDRIHRWLARAAALPFVPVPIASRTGRTATAASGRIWELAPWLPGRPEAARPPPPARVRAAFAGLAAFHGIFTDERRARTSPGLVSRLEEIEGLLAGGFERLHDRVLRAGGDAAVPAALRWLALARRQAPRARDDLRGFATCAVAVQPCLRDARPEHFLFEGDRLTGLVDYGAMGIECVAADLARLLAEWLDDRAGWTEALAAYVRVRPLDLDESRLIGPFARSAALLGGARWVRWHFLEGRTFERPEAVLEGIERGVDRLARLGAGPLIP
jgi:Ser/Thr protein kinase RdoA (MazF antagonist)